MSEAVAKRILVILPCHDEAGRVGSVIRSVKKLLPAVTVAVINDESSDNTGDEAARAGALILPHVVNLGYGAALETGYLFAIKHGYDAVVQMDGDGQHLPEELPKLISPIQEDRADIVIGSRYLDPSTAAHTPAIRRIGQKLFSGIVFLLTRKRITDPTSGFQALGRSAIRLFSSGVFPCDYPDADVVTMASMAGLRICEVPVRMALRTGGQSMHSGLKPLYYALKMMFSIFVVVLNRGMWVNWRQRLRTNRADK